MTKKILVVLAVIAILLVIVVSYTMIKSEKERDYVRSVEIFQSIAIEVKKSFDSTGFGAIQSVDDSGEEYYCNLIDADRCDYDYETAFAMKLVAIPAEGSVFGGWLNGCDFIETTNLDNDTCGVNVYKSKRATEARFIAQ